MWIVNISLMNSADKWIQTTPKLLNVAEQLCKAVGLAPQQGPSWCSSFSRTAQANCIPAWADPHSTVAIHSHGPVFWHTYVHVSVGWNCWITKDEYIQLRQIMLNSFPKWLYQVRVLPSGREGPPCSVGLCCCSFSHSSGFRGISLYFY